MSRVPYPHRTHHAQAMQLMTQKHTLTSTLTQLGGGASAARCSTRSRTSCGERVRKQRGAQTAGTHVDAHGIPPSQNLVLRIHELGGCGLRGGVIKIHGGRCGRRRWGETHVKLRLGLLVLFGLAPLHLLPSLSVLLLVGYFRPFACVWRAGVLGRRGFRVCALHAQHGTACDRLMKDIREVKLRRMSGCRRYSGLECRGVSEKAWQRQVST